MRTLGIRWNKLRKLINLQCGPGAAVLPSEVTRIHMDFAHALRNGHMGPRKFWREYLPRLKYHNPSIPMIVNRHRQNETAPKMTIYLRDGEASSPSDQSTVAAQPASSGSGLSKAQPPGPGERVVEIDMQNKHSAQILEYFLAETRAVPLKPTEAELAEIQDLERLKKQSEYDRQYLAGVRAEKKREADMLRRAREAGGMTD
ncbi:large subunit ribosomal protein MRP49 [Geosmithia morbida]|uniref:Large subunit ribosomal protein MRP49 n=1 Tax=Geosmithia morbida TaxID=1094350 RepID=A0A9P4YXE0_9HYPO|nr:large subunit ribosomal protein MRP49 [Geosmithia morbida]KAF4123805.1 large subunit ribosomal protein MRP49 [Geosmithia morbida]